MNFSRGHELWKKEGYRNGSGNFFCDNYMYSKNNEYKKKPAVCSVQEKLSVLPTMK